MYCECNYDDRPEFFRESKPTARKEHRCYECGATIKPGERYELHTGKWDGDMCSFKWCARCSDVAAFIRAHVPCFCWMYSSLHEDALSCAKEASRDAPGLWFGVARRVVAANRIAKP